jgi:hypothetical protein
MNSPSNLSPSNLVQEHEVPRRRFLWLFGALFGGMAALGLVRPARPAQEAQPGNRDLPLKEADFYRLHDLAG